MTQPPDWAINVPSTDLIHPSSTPDSQFVPPFTQQQLIQIGVQLVEQFLKRVLLAITGTFIPGAGPAFDQLASFFESFFAAFDGIDLSNPGAVVAAIVSAIENLINDIVGALTGQSGPLSFLSPLSWLFPAFLDNGDGTFTGVLDGLFTDNGDGTWSFIEDGIHTIIDNGDGTVMNPAGLLESLLGQLGTQQGLVNQQQTLIDTLFNALHLTSITGNQPNAIEQALADLMGMLGNPGLGSGTPIIGALQDIPILGDLQSTIDQAFDVLNFGVPGSTTGNPVTSFFGSLFGILGIGSNAQAINAVQDSIIYGGTSGIAESFDGPAGSGFPHFLMTITGSGGGTFDLDGSGNAHLEPSGSSVRGWFLRHNTALTTDQGSTQIVANSNIANGSIDDPAIYLMGRCNSAFNEYVVATAIYNSCEIGYVVGGTYTRIGSAAPLSGGTAGTWELKYGTTGGDERQFILLRNNVTVCDRTDVGNVSLMDSSHRYPAFGVAAGVSFSIFFGFPLQIAPPDIGAFAAFDRA